jgi:hypothetical protein
MTTELRVGNVYPCKGGRRKSDGRRTAYWVVVGLAGSGAQLVGIDEDGSITSATSYGKHVFSCPLYAHRHLLGRVEGLQGFKFKVQFNQGEAQ